MTNETKKEIIEELLTRNVSEVIEFDRLITVLNNGKKLRVKFGIDPTSKNLHLGHAVALNKLRGFQNLGHKIVLVIGDFTAQIGDPSGRDKTRPQLSSKEVKENFKTYLKQAEKILDIKKAEVCFNSEWYKKAGVKFFTEITSSITIQRLLERDDFQKRLKSENDITLLEAIYPLLQGYDSVAVRADLEIGGTDQKFNLLMGRRIQRRFNIQEQNIITLNLLVGTDGERKMSKTFGNTIELNSSPNDMFGKVMSISDNLIKIYFEAATALPKKNVDDTKKSIDSGKIGPMAAKKQLAYEVVKTYHGNKKADESRNYFEETFQKGKLAVEAPEIRQRTLFDLSEFAEYKLSKSELRRLIAQGAIEFNGKKIKDTNFIFKEQGILKIGKRRFFRIVPR